MTILQRCFAILACASSICLADESDELYDPHHIVKIEVKLAAKDWAELRGQSRLMVSAFGEKASESPFGYFECDVTIDGTTIKKAAVRKKGFLGSLDWKRPSLKLNLDKFVKGVKYKGIDNITLNNCKQDTSYLSQYLTYRTFRQAGMPAPRLNFAHVKVNGEDLGIYSNVEPVKTAFMRRNFNTENGAIYEGTLADFNSKLVTRFDRKTGKGDKSNRAKFKEVSQILKRDPLDVEALSKHIDMPFFYKFWAMESLIGFWDGYSNNQNNFFVFVDGRDQKIRFIPWGADVSFAKSLLGAILFQSNASKSVLGRATMPAKLYAHKPTRDIYFETLRQLLDTVWDEKELLAETKRVQAMLTPYIEQGATSKRGFDTSVDQVVQFIKARRKEITDELAAGVPKVADPSRPPKSEIVGAIHGRFDATWRKTADVPVETLQFKLEDGGKVEVTKLAVGVGGAKTVTVIFSGERKKEAKPFRIEITVPESAFRPDNRHPTQVQGKLTLGKSGFFSSAPTFTLAGTIKFERTSKKAGEPVSATLDLTAYNFRQF